MSRRLLCVKQLCEFTVIDKRKGGYTIKKVFITYFLIYRNHVYSREIIRHALLAGFNEAGWHELSSPALSC